MNVFTSIIILFFFKTKTLCDFENECDVCRREACNCNVRFSCNEKRDVRGRHNFLM